MTLLCRRQRYDLGDQHQELHVAIATGSAVAITADLLQLLAELVASP